MKKTFDCLKMKEELQTKIYEEIKDLSPDEKVDYFNRNARQNAWWNKLVNYNISKQKQGVTAL